MCIRDRPTAVKVLEGNPGKRSLNTAEPKPEKKAPRCPSSVSYTHLDVYKRQDIREQKATLPICAEYTFTSD